MEPQEKLKLLVSRADLAKAATFEEAYRRACALAQSKIDVELMIAVFKSLGETPKRPKPKKKNGLQIKLVEKTWKNLLI